MQFFSSAIAVIDPLVTCQINSASFPDNYCSFDCGFGKHFRSGIFAINEKTGKKKSQVSAVLFSALSESFKFIDGFV
jgi:hypothetical protein